MVGEQTKEPESSIVDTAHRSKSIDNIDPPANSFLYTPSISFFTSLSAHDMTWCRRSSATE